MTREEMILRHPRRCVMYDVKIDAFRYAVQADFDQLEHVVQAYGRMAGFFKKNHCELGKLLNWPDSAFTFKPNS